jgi:hypothetical protein
MLVVDTKAWEIIINDPKAKPNLTFTSEYRNKLAKIVITINTIEIKILIAKILLKILFTSFKFLDISLAPIAFNPKSEII